MTARRHQLVWEIVSLRHDWRASAWPRRLLAQLQVNGWVGTFAHARIGFDRKPMPTPPHEADQMPDTFWKCVPREKWAELEVDGTVPAPWSAFASFHMHEDDPEWLPMPSLLTLNIDLETVERTGGSVALLEAFVSLHSASNTDRAGIHLTSLRTRALGSATPFSAVFDTVLWANYLGPSLAWRVNREALAAVEGVDVLWQEDGGVFILLGGELKDLRTSALEARRKAVIQALLKGNW